MACLRLCNRAAYSLATAALWARPWAQVAPPGPSPASRDSTAHRCAQVCSCPSQSSCASSQAPLSRSRWARSWHCSALPNAGGGGCAETCGGPAALLPCRVPLLEGLCLPVSVSKAKGPACPASCSCTASASASKASRSEARLMPLPLAAAEGRRCCAVPASRAVAAEAAVRCSLSDNSPSVASCQPGSEDSLPAQCPRGPLTSWQVTQADHRLREKTSRLLRA